MLKSVNFNQVSIDDFILPFNGKLDEKNRWIVLAGKMPWKEIDEYYAEKMSEFGRGAFSSRLAFGSCIIKEYCHFSDEETVQAIAENPYLQYFVGLKEFTSKALFDASMIVHFRRRFDVQFVAKVNEYLATGKWPDDSMHPIDSNKPDDKNDPGEGGGETPPEAPAESDQENSSKEETAKCQIENHGKLLADATVAPADIQYPTDIELLNDAREILEKAIRLVWEALPSHEGHMLPYSTKRARKCYLSVAKAKKYRKSLYDRVRGELLKCVEQARKQLEVLLEKKPEGVSFPAWLKQRLQVIPLLYEQQKKMYDENTRTVENRIVSLQQNHVRPINRGKKPNPTEFGQKIHLSVVDGFTFIEKISWSNFNESKDLPTIIEEYRRKYNCYPEAVLADRIYQTRENKNYCKKRNIRLSGLPLGRRNKNLEKQVQEAMYQDSCERNAVEGAIGVAKRRYGLGKIKEKLRGSAMTAAAFCILAKNLARVLRDSLRIFLQWLSKCGFLSLLKGRGPKNKVFQ
ncbi:MAG: IS5 family transposase [Clostridia bacterium]|nr:IS5 family transposase [Clostridia bacterium]